MISWLRVAIFSGTATTMTFHDIYANPRNGKKAPIPRHGEIKNTLAELIRKQFGLR